MENLSDYQETVAPIIFNWSSKDHAVSLYVCLYVHFHLKIFWWTADSEINIIVQDNSDLVLETITGIFKDCDGNLITNGYVKH